MAYTSVITNWSSYSNSNFNIAISNPNFDPAGDQSIANSVDLTKDSSGNALYSRFDTSTGTKYLLLRAAVDPSFSQKLIVNFDINTGSGFDGKIDFALVVDLGVIPNGTTPGTPVANGVYATGSQSGSLNTQPNNTDFYIGASSTSSMQIADSAVSKTTISGNTYVDVIVNFDNLYALLQDASSTDGDAEVVASPYPTFSENTPIRFALTSSTNLNNVNKDISGSATNSLATSWSSYLSSNTSSLSNLVAGAPSITAIAENSSGGINATEAVDGTGVAVSLAGTNAVAGNTLTLTWGSRTVAYTLTAIDILTNSATVTVPAATITAQGNGTFNVTAKIGSGLASPAVSVTVDTTAPTAPTISGVPENADGGINLTEAADGTAVNVSLAGIGAVAGDRLTVNWGSQSTSYTLTASDITSNSVSLTIPAATLTTQGNGTFNVTAYLTDQAGNTGGTSAALSVTVDATALITPTITSIPEAIGGLNASEVSDGTQVLVGLTLLGAVTGDKLTINWGSQAVNYTLTLADILSGTATVTIPAATIATQGNGTFNVTAKLTDQVGNVSPNSTPVSVTVDITNPTAPAISGIPEATGGLNLAEATDGTVVNVSLTGTGAIAGDTLTLSWGSQTVNYSLTPTDITSGVAAVTVPTSTLTAQGNGTVPVTAKLIDQAGNASPSSNPVSVLVDSLAPTAPTISSIPESAGGIDAAESADGTPVAVNLSGTGAVAGDILTINWGSQTSSAILTPSEITSGSATVTVPAATIAAQGVGTFNVTAQLSDAVGNSSASSQAIAVTVNSAPANAPSLSLPEAAGGLNAAEAIDGTPVIVTLTGTGAVAGDSLTINWGSQAISYTLTASDITNSSATVTIPPVLITAAGEGTVNVSAQVGTGTLSSPVAVTVDKTIPAAPAIASIPESTGGLNAAAAADGTIVTVDLTGTGAAAGDQLTLNWGTQTTTYTLTSTDIANNSVAIAVSNSIIAAQGNGTFNITAHLTDQSGNTSPTSTPFPVTVDIAAPAAPVLSSLPETAGGLNANEAADGTIVAVNLSGTAALAGDTLTIAWGSQSVDYTLTNTDITTGSASVTVPAATIAAEGDGNVSVTAKLTDQAGNSSANSLPASVIVDTVAAGTPAIASLPETTGGLNRTEASDGTPVTVTLAATGATAGDTLTLNWGNQTVTYSLTAADISNGSATVTVSAATIAAQGNGSFDVTASLTDPAGNRSPRSSPVSITVDTVASIAPTIAGIAEAAGGINAIEATDGTTVAVSLTGTGAVAGDTLTLNWGNQPINYTLTSSDISSGSVTIAVSAATIAAQGDGSFDVTATLTDQAGNLSNASSPVSVAVQTTAPAAPTIGAIPEAIGGVNGAEAGDGTIVSVSLTGTGAAAGDTLTLSWGSQTVDYLLSNADITTGTAIVTVTAATIAAQADGPVNVTATLTNQAGNPSPSSTVVPVIVDTIAPTAASISIPEASNGINATEAADGTTVEVNLTGTGAVAGDTLTVNWGGQTVNYTLTAADITGNTATVAVDAATLSAQGNGTFDVTAQLTDAAGNSGPLSTAVSVTVNTTPASAPSLSLPEAANGLNQAEAADGTDLVITLTGTGAVAGDSLSITWGSQTLNYTLTANDISSATATASIPAATIAAQGGGTFGVTAQIGTGPVSSTLAVTVDTVAPAAPTLISIPEATGGLNGSEAADGTVVVANLTGTGAVAGDTLTVTWGTATVGYTLTAADITNTNAVVTVPASVLTAQGEGSFNVTASLTDQAGNRSPASSPVTVTVDTTAPAAPAISDIPEAAAGLSNAEATDGVDVIVSLTGTTAVAGDTVTLTWGNQTIAYLLTSGDITTGSAVVTVVAPTIVAQGDGTFNVTAILTDQAGNSSLPSSPFSITVDTIVPSAPTIAAIPEGLGEINAIEAANGTAVTVSLVGTGAIAGDKLTLTWGSQTVDYTLTANDLTTGSVQIAVPASILSAQGDGTFNVTANLTDQTGNSSSNANPVSVMVNTTAPSAPVISAISEAAAGINSSEAADGIPVEVSLSGTGAAAGDSLTIDWGGQPITYTLTTADITAGRTIVTVPPATIAAQGDGAFTVTAQLTDSAGNPSPLSAPVTVTVDTIAPAVPAISSIPEAASGINATEAADGTAVTLGLTGIGAIAGDRLRLNWGSQTIDYILTSSDISSGSTTIAVSASTIAAQGDGTVNVTAQLTDQAGNTSFNSAPVAVTIDTAAPAAPTILDLPEAVGGLNRDESANGTPVNVSLAGTGAAAGDTLTLNWGAQPLSYVLTNSDITANKATVTIPTQLINAAGEGTIAVTAQLSDRAGNVGPQSAAVSAIVDLTLPSLANTVVNGNTLILTYSEPLASSTPAANAYSVTVNGSAAPISAIAITNSAVALTLANPVNPGDSVAVSYSQPGTNPLQDTAGNAASAFVNRSVTNSTIDTTAPTVDRLTPSALTLSDATASSGTFTLTAVYSEAMNPSIAPTFSFPTASEDPASTLSFVSGSWTNATTYVVTFNVIDADTNLPPIDVQIGGAVDTMGNAQPAVTFTDVFNIKTTNPTVALSSDAPAIINAPFTVTAVFSEAVTGFTSSDITISNGSITADPTSSDGGLTYRFTVSPTNNGTVSVSIGDAIAQDRAGNGNAAAPSALTRTAELTAQLPAAPALAADSDTGTSNADDVTADPTPTFTGIAEANSTVRVFANGVLLRTVTTAVDGTWSATPETPLSDGVYSITTTVTDAAGNTSPTSAAIAVTIDTTTPTGSLDVSSFPSDDNPQGTLLLQINEPVNTVDLADFTLTRDGTPISLNGATLTTTDGINWVISNLDGQANDSGTYTLTFTPRNDITDRAGNRLQGVISRSWSVEECHLGVATPNINFKGGKRGIRRRGTNARNRLNGTRRNDMLNGLKGNDILKGKSGNDRLNGGLGRDDLRGDAGRDKLTGYRGNDRLNGGTNRDWLDGGSGNDRIVGGSGDDILLGGLGRDTLRGGQGRDMFVLKSITQGVDRITDFNPATDLLDLRSIFARPTFRGDEHRLYRQLIQRVQVGNNTEIRIDRDGTGPGTAQSTLFILNNLQADAIDCSNFVLSGKACQLGIPTPAIRFDVGKRGIQFRGKSSNDRVRGTQNNDRLQGNTGNDTLQGRAGRDRLSGDRGNDSLNGGSDRDWLSGGANRDRLVGGSGDDVLIGGSGRDILTGGRGRDMFVLQTLTQEGDRITDFKGNADLLDLRSIFARREFAGARSHAIHSHLLQTVQRGSNTEIQIDADGNGAGKMFTTVVTLEKVAAQTISCSNFVL